LREGKNVGSHEIAILQVTNVRPIFRAREQSLRKVDAGYLDVRETLGKTAGVKAGAAGYFE
jgi:hypothetical protein